MALPGILVSASVFLQNTAVCLLIGFRIIVIRDESDTSTRLDTLRIEYEDRLSLLGEGDTYP